MRWGHSDFSLSLSGRRLDIDRRAVHAVVTLLYVYSSFSLSLNQVDTMGSEKLPHIQLWLGLTGELSFLIGEKIDRGLASLRSPIRFYSNTEPRQVFRQVLAAGVK